MSEDGAKQFLAQALSPDHRRERFHCGVASLDSYLKTQATQDMRRKANAVFVFVHVDEPSRILGYFTLCALGLERGEIPEQARVHLPRYPLVSATLIGGLAVDLSVQGRGIGRTMLAAAVTKAYRNADVVGSSMLVVDAIDERAHRFYEAFSFLPLQDSMRLILPMRTIAGLAELA